MSTVRLWEAPLSIPTYPVGEPEKNPIFFTGRTYQGAKGPMYPYPLLDKLSTAKQDKNYRAVNLQNSYFGCDGPAGVGRAHLRRPGSDQWS